MKSIYEIELNEEITTEQGTKITRVPNGWIYTFFNHSIFVNYDAEFKYNNVKEYKFTDIERVVTNYFDLPNKFYYKNNKAGTYPLAKIMIASLADQYVSINQNEIAKKLKYKDRTSITYAKKKIIDLCKYNTKIRNQYEEINRILNSKEA